jgi:hypothetical protein
MDAPIRPSAPIEREAAPKPPAQSASAAGEDAAASRPPAVEAPAAAPVAKNPAPAASPAATPEPVRPAPLAVKDLRPVDFEEEDVPDSAEDRDDEEEEEEEFVPPVQPQRPLQANRRQQQRPEEDAPAPFRPIAPPPAPVAPPAPAAEVRRPQQQQQQQQQQQVKAAGQPPAQARKPQPQQQAAPAAAAAARRPQPAVQQKRPNYPAEYQPTKPQKNDLEDERQPAEDEEEREAGEEEEEEVKPDKLQLLLQQTKFSCAELKDGYYADEAVECQIFHYCQDRTRHSWLCPEGATFHQVHLICMPATKENICQKSSEFHFVNEYLYKPIEDEYGNNNTFLYADRYYPDGYEPGVPFDMANSKKPEKNQYQTAAQNRRPQNQPRVRPQGNEYDNRRQDSRVPIQQRKPLYSDEEYEQDSRPMPSNRRSQINQRPMMLRTRPLAPIVDDSIEDDTY